MKTKLFMKVRKFKYWLLAAVLSPLVNKKYIGLYKHGRRVGNTTRLVDLFVQDFFNNGECRVVDHYGTTDANLRIFRIVLDRLNREHMIGSGDVVLDSRKFIIRRKQ